MRLIKKMNLKNVCVTLTTEDLQCFDAYELESSAKTSLNHQIKRYQPVLCR